MLGNVSWWPVTDRDDTTVGFHRLVAAPGALTAAEVAPDLAGRGRARRDRPHVAVNMVASVDGRATLAGRAGPLGNPADRALFRRLRAQVDAVMVGAGTLRAERYGPIISDPAVREERRQRGLEADPWAVLVSRSLDLPPDLPLPGPGVARHRDRRPGRRDRAVRGPGRVPAQTDLGRALAELRARHGIVTLLCEGGPHLNASLLREGLADELFLAIAATLVGAGEALTIVAGALPEPAELTLTSLHESEGYLFARYAIG